MKFDFKAVDAEGFSHNGSLEAASENEALDTLYGRGLTPLSMRMGAMEQPLSWGSSASKKVSFEDLAALTRELATLLHAGVGLVDAFETLLEGTQQLNMAEPISAIVRSLHAGQSLSVALQASRLPFPHYIYALAKAGEATGQMGPCLNSAAEQMEFDIRLRNETKEAMTYPIILVATGVMAIAFIFAFVVPRFSTLLEGKGVDLPLLSVWVLASGKFVNQYWIQILLGAAGLAALLFSLAQNQDMRRTMRNMAAGLPIVGPWLTAGETARWTSMISVLLSGRVPMLTSVDLASSSVLLERTKALLTSVGADVRVGKSLSVAVGERPLLNPAALTMLKVGEKSGELPMMMHHVAQASAANYRTIQRRVVTLMEPLSILFIGIVLGTIMIGVVLAMTSLTEIKF
jgi:general secretion pathway protein F